MATWNQTGAAWIDDEQGPMQWNPTQRAAAANALRTAASHAAVALEQARVTVHASDARRILADEALTMRAIADQADHHSLGGAPAVDAKRRRVNEALNVLAMWERA